MKSEPQSRVIDCIGIVIGSLEIAFFPIEDDVNIEQIDTAEKRGWADQT